MYEDLDFYLNDYASISDLNYFYDAGYKDIVEIIDQFTEEDWEELFSHLDDKNGSWKEILVYCVNLCVSDDDPHKARLLENLAQYSLYNSTEELFEMLAIRRPAEAPQRVDKQQKKRGFFAALWKRKK